VTPTRKLVFLATVASAIVAAGCSLVGLQGAESLAVGRSAEGKASFYGKEHAGERTASGERYDPEALTAAHPSLPFGARLKVTNLANGRSVVVRVNDRGPYLRGRTVDLSLAAARALGAIGEGVARVRIERLR
jgi:rare lipoprotein A